MTNLKPIDFRAYPWDSVFQNAEHEIVARNIMIIMDDHWKELSWEQYKSIRKKDGWFCESERKYFDAVIKYCKSEDTARCFSPVWEKVGR
jgi:hypothetical protein